MKILLSLVLIPALISGCASTAKSTLDYKEPISKRIENEVLVKKDFDYVWDALIKQLAKSFFVVNNIEKESRLINVSFSTEEPEKYIDCGESSRTFNLGDEVIKTNYEVASDSSYKYGNGKSQNGQASLVAYINRKTSLEGRINIYLAPNNSNTVVSVNVKYLFTTSVTGKNTAVNIYGNVIATQDITPSSSTISFSTNQENKSKSGMICHSRGVLENEVLNMATKI